MGQRKQPVNIDLLCVETAIKEQFLYDRNSMNTTRCFVNIGRNCLYFMLTSTSIINYARRHRELVISCIVEGVGMEQSLLPDKIVCREGK